MVEVDRMKLIYDSRNEFFKTPFGCIKCEEKADICVYCDEKADKIFLLLYQDGKDEKRIVMTKTNEADGYGTYSVSLVFNEPDLYFYRFCVEKNGQNYVFGRNDKNNPSLSSQNSWQLLCTDKNRKVSDSFCGKIYYQIFPDRFAKDGSSDLSEKLEPYWVHDNMNDIPKYMPNEHGIVENNDFFGGNLKGIIKKLDYLKNMGVDIIYLNPIFMAHSNHRYDTADYKRIDPMLGPEEDFVLLCNEAHKRNIKIILDGVFSHTGDNSVYFDKYNHFGNGAVSNSNSPYRSWYRFSKYPYEYESWWGISTLPCVDEMNPSYLDFIITGEDSVIRHWLRKGADGFRLDVADELPDEFINALYKTVKEEKTESVVIGEVWEDASNKISYGVRRKYLWGSELDGVMNYVYRTAVIDFVMGIINAETFAERIMQLAENYPEDALLSSMNFLSTHDTARILNVLSGSDINGTSKTERANKKLNDNEYKTAAKRLSAAVFLIFALPGSPCIYYGDEIGMQGYEDPFNRGFYTWNNADESIRQIYSLMIDLRKNSSALSNGDIYFCEAKDGLIKFLRKNKNEEVLCALNLSDRAVSIPLLSTKALGGMGFVSDGKKITLLPYGNGVFKIL